MFSSLVCKLGASSVEYDQHEHLYMIQHIAIFHVCNPSRHEGTPNVDL